MKVARGQILGTIRHALGTAAPDARDSAAVARRLATRPHGPVPARGHPGGAAGDAADRLALFQRMAEEASASVARLADPADIPAAIARYLAQENLPAAIRLAPALESLPWHQHPLLTVSSGASDGQDPVAVTAAFGGVAETGTLTLVSGPDTPTTLNLLPDTHIVVLAAGAVLGSYEEIWARLRARYGEGALPRTVNFITGPSRSADIEQKLQMGAHGPRRLHILLVEGDTLDRPGDIVGQDSATASRQARPGA